MRIATLVQFLFGDRRSIVEVAGNPRAVWLGLVFVISAGFAREYDGEDLLHEPWHVLLPLAASLLTSFLLFVLVETAFARGWHEPGQPSSFLARYRAFLSLYWMTAPLAWLYALPVERFLAAADAVRANLWMLGIVSLWRVALMTRIVSVVYARPAVAALFVVMLFADTLAVVVAWLIPVPILSVMGGIRLTESESVIATTGFLLCAATTLSWPVWFVGACVCAVRARKMATEPSEIPSAPQSSRRVAWGLWALSACSILLWTAVLPFTQGEQQNRRRVEADLCAGRIDEAVQFMSQRERDDFPPHWDPPPRIGYGEREPPLFEVLLALDRAETAPWARELFREKLAVQSDASPYGYAAHAFRLHDMDDARLARYARFLKSLPEGPAIARAHEMEIRDNLNPQEVGTEPQQLSPQRRAALEEILSLFPKDDRRFNPAPATSPRASGP